MSTLKANLQSNIAPFSLLFPYLWLAALYAINVCELFKFMGLLSIMQQSYFYHVWVVLIEVYVTLMVDWWYCFTCYLYNGAAMYVTCSSKIMIFLARI